MSDSRRVREREALFWLVVSRLMVALLPFRKIAAYLGKQGGESLRDVSAGETEYAFQVRNVVMQVCRRVHWKPTCLVRAVAAMLLLRRRGVGGTLYLGVAREPGKLRAHAWVRCGNVLIVGAHGRRQYQVIGTFTRVPAA